MVTEDNDNENGDNEGEYRQKQSLDGWYRQRLKKNGENGDE